MVSATRWACVSPSEVDFGAHWDLGFNLTDERVLDIAEVIDCEHLVGRFLDLCMVFVDEGLVVDPGLHLLEDFLGTIFGKVWRHCYRWNIDFLSSAIIRESNLG